MACPLLYKNFLGNYEYTVLKIGRQKAKGSKGGKKQSGDDGGGN